jgi:hypothetical protein
MKTITAFFVLALLWQSCRQKIDDAPRELGRSYYNTKAGSWISYKIDSIVFSDFNQQVQKIDTFHFQIKEVLADHFTDAAGMETNRIEIYRRPGDSAAWTIDRVWTSNISDRGLEVTEGNQRYLKMVFPVALNKSWDGNQFNTNPSWNYSYRNINEAKTFNGISFNETVTVLQKDSSTNTFISQGFAQEVYAKNIGLIFRQTDTVEVQNSIKKGLYYRQTITDWSK